MTASFPRLRALARALRSYLRYRDFPAAYGVADAVHAFTGRKVDGGDDT